MSDLPTADQLEDVLHAALKAQDMRGMVDALKLMVAVDPQRAVRLYDDLQDALAIAAWVRNKASDNDSRRDRRVGPQSVYSGRERQTP